MIAEEQDTILLPANYTNEVASQEELEHSIRWCYFNRHKIKAFHCHACNKTHEAIIVRSTLGDDVICLEHSWRRIFCGDKALLFLAGKGEWILKYITTVEGPCHTGGIKVEIPYEWDEDMAFKPKQPELNESSQL